MIRETIYNEIFDSQRHFRTILDSMSRPGKVNRFAPVPLTPPVTLHKAAAYVGFALLNADASFHAAPLGDDAVGYLRANTAGVIAEPLQADFIFIDGAMAGSESLVSQAKVGIPTYPETGSTVVIQVSAMGKSSAIGGLQLILEGPGVETREIVFVTGLRPELLAALAAKNVEFPLGVDAILVGADDCLLCLPRTTKVTWANL